jgi:poly-gamma-glutamate capsule biosynthesis protein CapA/YwtB (metallophosphatase superfamily)
MDRPIRLLAIATVVLAAAAPAAEAGEGGRTFTIAAAGDVIIHRAIAAAAQAHALSPGSYDFGPLLRPVEPWISDADLAICHLEGTLSPTNTGLLYQQGDEHPAYFNGPHEVAEALSAAGYDACSTAGNHAMDRGLTGVRETLEVLDAAGIGHSGTARSATERLPTLYRVNGVRVAHIAYTIGTNEPRPSEAGWAVNIIDADAIVADARWARERGSEFTVVSLHWGTQYQATPDGLQERLAEALAASPDIDLILGHHAHTVQPIERIGTKVVVYGMGNHLSNIRTMPDGSKSGAEDGVVVHLTVAEQTGGGFAVTGVEFTATWVDPATKRVLPVAHNLAYGSDPALLPSLTASQARTVERVGLLGGEGIAATPTPWPSLVCEGKVATVAGTSGPDLLLGTQGDDVIVGRGGGDTIFGGDGSDLICGGDGDDWIWGSAGRDALYGGKGNDMLSGGDGGDLLWGEEGDDRLGGGDQGDALYGGSGDDVLSGQGGDDLLVAGPGTDVLWGGTGNDALTGSSPDDGLYGDAGDTCRIGPLVVRCGA